MRARPEPQIPYNASERNIPRTFPDLICTYLWLPSDLQAVELVYMPPSAASVSELCMASEQSEHRPSQAG